MKTLLIVVITVVVVIAALAAGFYVYFSHGSFSASQKPGWFETTMVEAAQELALPKDVEKMKNPGAADADALGDGQMHFVELCAICHGPDGKGQTLIGKNVYPPPPDLTSRDTQEASDGELFYIVSNGIRFSGMPAFGGTHGKEDIWNLVTFVRHLPQLTPEELQAIKQGMTAVNLSQLEQHGQAGHQHEEAQPSPPKPKH